MLRGARRIMLVLAVALAAANAVVFLYVKATHEVADEAERDRWLRWRNLPRSEQIEYVRQYQSLSRRADFGAVLRNAGKFHQQSERGQENWRELHRVQEDILERLTPARRRDLLRASPRNRAFFIYHELQTRDPRRLAELMARLTRAS